jgi:hypothetical protein
MSGDSEGDREQGVEFGTLVDDLEDGSYPMSHDELLENYGDHEIVLMDQRTTLREVIGPEHEREYEDPESVRQAVFNMVGDDAVGREGYSDRGVNSPGEDSSDEEESI